VDAAITRGVAHAPYADMVWCETSKPDMKQASKFQFVTLAGFHALNLGMFNLARSYRDQGMLAYAEFQQEEFAGGKEKGYMATTHQKFVGAGYFDRLMESITAGKSSTAAMKGSTEESQFTWGCVAAPCKLGLVEWLNR